MASMGKRDFWPENLFRDRLIRSPAYFRGLIIIFHGHLTISFSGGPFRISACFPAFFEIPEILFLEFVQYFSESQKKSASFLYRAKIWKSGCARGVSGV